MDNNYYKGNQKKKKIDTIFLISVLRQNNVPNKYIYKS